MTTPLGDPESFFFKYMSEDVAKVVLTNGTLRWSTPHRLNDPFDIQFDLHFNIDRERIKKSVLKNLWDGHYAETPPKVGNFLGGLIAYSRGKIPQIPQEEFDREFGKSIDAGFANIERTLPETVAQLREGLDRSKILCLSKTPTATLMWSHYANSHRGLVIGFRDVPQLDSPWKAGYAITYLDKVPPILDEEALIDLLSGYSNLDPGRLLRQLIFTKSNHWAYEREWRIFSGVGRNELAPFEDIPFHKLELGAAIFGCHMTEVSQREFYDLITSHYSHVRLFHAVKIAGTFDLAIVPYRP